MSRPAWYIVESGDIMSSRVHCTAQRTHNKAGPAWLLSISVPMFLHGRHFERLAVQCRAVVDDFGTLVPVTEWQ